MSARPPPGSRPAAPARPEFVGLQHRRSTATGISQRSPLAKPPHERAGALGVGLKTRGQARRHLHQEILRLSVGDQMHDAAARPPPRSRSLGCGPSSKIGAGLGASHRARRRNGLRLEALRAVRLHCRLPQRWPPSMLDTSAVGQFMTSTASVPSSCSMARIAAP